MLPPLLDSMLRTTLVLLPVLILADRSLCVTAGVDAVDRLSCHDVQDRNAMGGGGQDAAAAVQRRKYNE